MTAQLVRDEPIERFLFFRIMKERQKEGFHNL